VAERTGHGSRILSAIRHDADSGQSCCLGSLLGATMSGRPEANDNDEVGVEDSTVRACGAGAQCARPHVDPERRFVSGLFPSALRTPPMDLRRSPGAPGWDFPPAVAGPAPRSAGAQSVCGRAGLLDLPDRLVLPGPGRAVARAKGRRGLHSGRDLEHSSGHGRRTALVPTRLARAEAGPAVRPPRRRAGYPLRARSPSGAGGLPRDNAPSSLPRRGWPRRRPIGGRALRDLLRRGPLRTAWRSDLLARGARGSSPLRTEAWPQADLHLGAPARPVQRPMPPCLQPPPLSDGSGSPPRLPDHPRANRRG
jgi:hypothetical protein